MPPVEPSVSEDKYEVVVLEERTSMVGLIV